MSNTDTEVLEPIAEAAPGERSETADLPAALARAAPRRWTNRATPVLFSVLLLSGGFLGGVVVHKQWGKVSSATATQQTPARGGLPSGGPGGGFPIGGAEREGTTGTLTSVTADSLTMRTAAGGTVTVKLGASTKVQQTTTLAKLRTGQSVTVQGSTATDGTITATTVTGS